MSAVRSTADPVGPEGEVISPLCHLSLGGAFELHHWLQVPLPSPCLVQGCPEIWSMYVASHEQRSMRDTQTQRANTSPAAFLGSSAQENFVRNLSATWLPNLAVSSVRPPDPPLPPPSLSASLGTGPRAVVSAVPRTQAVAVPLGFAGGSCVLAGQGAPREQVGQDRAGVARAELSSMLPSLLLPPLLLSRVPPFPCTSQPPTFSPPFLSPGPSPTCLRSWVTLKYFHSVPRLPPNTPTAITGPQNLCSLPERVFCVGSREWVVWWGQGSVLHR